MDVLDFLEKFLPDYEAKSEVMNNRIKMLVNTPTTRTSQAIMAKINNIESNFIDKYFQEALQNFVDQICKKQREECNDLFLNYYDQYDYSSMDYLFRTDQILNAKQPKIDEL